MCIRGPNNDKERVMWLAAIQLVSGRHWQDNRARIDAELAALPARRPRWPCCRRTSPCSASARVIWTVPRRWGRPHPAATGRLGQGARDLAGGRGHADPDPGGGPYPHQLPWCSTRTAELRGHYHKIHLFDVDVADNHGRYRESETFSPGEVPVLVDSPLGPLGLSIWL